MDVPLGAISAVCGKLFDRIPSGKDTLCQVRNSMMKDLLYSVILENFLM